MSVVVQIPPGSGNLQTIPTQGDEGWGIYTSQTLIALAAATFPKQGGNYFITGDVNFGVAFGLIARYFTSASTSPSATGVLRLANSDTIGFRNNANNADLELGVNATDELTFNGNLIPTVNNPIPTYGVNLTGSNGTSDYALRTDVVLKLDPSISPTWTGNHEFTQNVQMDSNLQVNNIIQCAELNTTSDQNLKENIVNIYQPLDKIFELNGVTFNWKSDKVESVGLIAQDVEKVFPELVNEVSGTKHLNYLGIIGLLVEAVKDLHLEVELLKRGFENGHGD